MTDWHDVVTGVMSVACGFFGWLRIHDQGKFREHERANGAMRDSLHEAKADMRDLREKVARCEADKEHKNQEITRQEKARIEVTIACNRALEENLKLRDQLAARRHRGTTA